jgi:hypothetical protein
MKFTALLAIVALATSSSTTYATEENSANSDYLAYCNEQADLSGIENAEEKSRYVGDCIDSFTTPSGDTQPQD